jgi:hypothetical protein
VYAFCLSLTLTCLFLCLFLTYPHIYYYLSHPPPFISHFLSLISPFSHTSLSSPRRSPWPVLNILRTPMVQVRTVVLCIVLYFIKLYCSVLYYTVLYVLYYTVLYAALYCTVLRKAQTSQQSPVAYNASDSLRPLPYSTQPSFHYTTLSTLLYRAVCNIFPFFTSYPFVQFLPWPFLPLQVFSTRPFPFIPSNSLLLPPIPFPTLPFPSFLPSSLHRKESVKEECLRSTRGD